MRRKMHVSISEGRHLYGVYRCQHYRGRMAIGAESFLRAYWCCKSAYTCICTYHICTKWIKTHQEIYGYVVKFSAACGLTSISTAVASSPPPNMWGCSRTHFLFPVAVERQARFLCYFSVDAYFSRFARSFTRSPSSRHPPFTQYPFPMRSLVRGGH
jgi:hypothetical protein